MTLVSSRVSLATAGAAGFVAAAICFFGALDRGGLRLALHRVRERLREQEDGRDDAAARARSRRRGSRRASPSARGGSVRRVHRTARPQRHSFRYARGAAPASTPTSARDRRRATSRPTSRARARQPRRRAPSGARRRAGRPRSRGSASLPATAAQASVQLRDRRVPAGADVDDAAVVTDRREQRGDDVADVDEVAALPAVAEDRSSRRRARSARGRSRRRRPRGRRPGAGRRRSPKRSETWRRAVDAVPAGEVLLAADLGDAVRRERQERRVLVGGRGALAVDRAARRREDHLRALARPREHVHGADDVDRRVVARALHRGLHVGLRGEVEDDVGARLENGSRMSCSTSVAAAFTFSRLPVAKSSTTVTSSPRATRASTRFDPMKPAPPVTTARMEAVS